MPREEDLPKLKTGSVVKGKYFVRSIIGAGAFGAVYQVCDVKSGEMLAMKTESATERTRILKMEKWVLMKLKRKGSLHVCRIIDHGRGQDRKWVFVVMTLLGTDLLTLRKARKSGRFSLPTAVRVGMQCLAGLRDLHQVGVLHRDIKPGNFAIGREETKQDRTIFILDFGLCRRFRNDKGEIKTPRDKVGFRGTVRYAPLNSHTGVELGRSDDLEGWFYLLLEATNGRVPWWNVPNRDEVEQAKETCRKMGNLCKNAPPFYSEIINYIDALKYWDEPDYEFIWKVLKKILTDEGIDGKEPYDWQLLDSPLNTTQNPSSKGDLP